MHRLPFFLSCLILTICAVSCGDGSDNQARDAADSFSVAYFNWRFAEALPYTTPRSHRWLSYAASQVDEEDVDSLRAMADGAKTDIKSVRRLNDSTAMVEINVSNFLSLDSIGKAPHIINNASFHLLVVCDNGTWKVDLQSMPRGH